MWSNKVALKATLKFKHYLNVIVNKVEANGKKQIKKILSSQWRKTSWKATTQPDYY